MTSLGLLFCGVSLKSSSIFSVIFNKNSTTKILKGVFDMDPINQGPHPEQYRDQEVVQPQRGDVFGDAEPVDPVVLGVERALKQAAHQLIDNTVVPTALEGIKTGANMSALQSQHSAIHNQESAPQQVALASHSVAAGSTVVAGEINRKLDARVVQPVTDSVKTQTDRAIEKSVRTCFVPAQLEDA